MIQRDTLDYVDIIEKEEMITSDKKLHSEIVELIENYNYYDICTFLEKHFLDNFYITLDDNHIYQYNIGTQIVSYEIFSDIISYIVFYRYITFFETLKEGLENDTDIELLSKFIKKIKNEFENIYNKMFIFLMKYDI
jgi:hypothetical protein